MKDPNSSGPFEGFPPFFHSWLAEPPSPELRGLLARIAKAEDVRHVAVMPDAHVADQIAVGCVVGTTRLLYPEAVGGDLGCGMAALSFEGDARALDDDLACARILAGFESAIPAIRHRGVDSRAPLPDGLEQFDLSAPRLEAWKRKDGRAEFGTLGRGNHFVEVLGDDAGTIWLLVHSGSRAVGRAIFDHHCESTLPKPSGFVALPEDSPEGEAYLHDLSWALRYAEASRARIVASAAAILERVLGIRRLPDSAISCHHNHVRVEMHAGQRLLVHRKGAISAAPSEPGIVPGSMGTTSYLVCGRGDPASLASSAHGAGRALSRAAASKSISSRDLERQMSGVRFDRRLTASLRSEAPSAYKDIDTVLRAQRSLVRITHRLHPLLAYKAP